MAIMSNADIINAALGSDFSDRIPAATQANMAEVGEAILNYAPAKNQFLDCLFNKIGLTLISTLEFENPFARYRGQNIPYGDTVEDIYVGLIEGYEYDKTNTDPFGQQAGNVTAIYHTINVELQYKVSVNDALLRRAFRSANGLSDLVTKLVASTVESADYDEYLNTCKMLSSNDILGAQVVMGAKTGTAATDAKTLTKAIKNVATQMRFVGKKFNRLQKECSTPYGRQLVIIRADMRDSIDIDFLAGLFNMSKAEIVDRIIEVPEFIDKDYRAALVVDERGFELHKALVDGGLIYNPQGKYTNHFYNNWEIISWSLYRNAVALDFLAEVVPTLVWAAGSASGSTKVTITNATGVSSWKVAKKQVAPIYVGEAGSGLSADFASYTSASNITSVEEGQVLTLVGLDSSGNIVSVNYHTVAAAEIGA